jgi:1,4-alpha-glucan branching enzyme
MIKGYWMPVLHSHLPFVKHPEYDYFLEEHWLFEAISETYIPLLMAMNRMVDEKIEFRLTLSVTPPLCEMLSDPYLTEQFKKYIHKLIELSKKECIRLGSDKDNLKVAEFYLNRFETTIKFFEGFLDSNVLNGYRFFYEQGLIDIITCGATHGFLPVLRVNKRAVEVQVELAAQTHNKYFNKRPEGIWLPECAYYEGLDEILKQNGIKYFFLDSHGLTKGMPSPKHGVYAPVYTVNGVAAFARDPESSRQVWSSKAGYPGDPVYRDFYRDIGFDLDFEYIKPYISPDGKRVYTGIKYFSITGGEAEEKKIYDPEVAHAKTKSHAWHFYSERLKQFDLLSGAMDRPPMVVSPYDAELFGHWWFEGPEFLYNIFREASQNDQLKAVTPIEYLSQHPNNQVIAPCPSSWGEDGYYSVWLNEGNDWIYRHLHYMADTLEKLANEYKHSLDEDTVANIIKRRALNQLARELLLAQSSDWAFLVTQETAVEYSTKRTKEHISNFNRLLKDFLSTGVDEKFLEWLETKNSIFEDIDFKIYSSPYV